MASNRMAELKWLLDTGSQHIGPLGGKELEALLSSGTLSAETRVRAAGTDDWHQLAEGKETLMMLAHRSIDDLCETVERRSKILVERLRAVYKRAEERGVASLEGGVPGEEYFIYVGPFLIDIDGTLTVDEDWAQDVDAVAPGSSRGFAYRLSEITSFAEAAHIDFIGGLQLKVKLGDIPEAEWMKLLGCLVDRVDS